MQKIDHDVMKRTKFVSFSHLFEDFADYEAAHGDDSCPKVWHVSAIFGRFTYFSAIVGILRQRYDMKQEHPIYDHVRQTSAIFGNLMI